MKLSYILKQYRWSITFVTVLVVLQGTGYLLFPLFIGYAIDDLIAGSHAGLINLSILGAAELVIGTSRRFFDTRIYAKIYRSLGAKIISDDKDSSESVLSARVHMFEELTYFMEKSMPELITALVSLLGTIVILYSLSFNIFIGCL